MKKDDENMKPTSQLIHNTTKVAYPNLKMMSSNRIEFIQFQSAHKEN